MTSAALDQAEDSRATVRWGVSFACVLAAHIGIGLVLLQRSTTPLPLVDQPVVILDLPPPEPVVEAPPPPPVEEPPPPEPVPTVEPEPPPPEPPPPEPVQVEPPPPEPLPEPTPIPDPVKPPPPPPPRRPVVVQHNRPPVPRPATPPPPNPVVAAPVTPAPVVSQQAVAAATASWQSRLQAHLARFKRYPAEAQMRQQEGTPMLRFTMTRDGRVTSFSLAKSSGHDALDREALALIERAQPLPALPADVPQATIQLVVPLRFQLR